MIFQSRQAREAREMAHQSAEEVARLRREAEERLSRHQKEAEERIEEAAERKAEREQKEKLLSELQSSNKETLDFMKAQLKAQQESGANRYSLIERNTAITEKLAVACAAQASELRVLVDRLARLEGGAGCRAIGGRAA